MTFEKYGDFWTMQDMWWIFLILLAIVILIYFYMSNKKKQKTREKRWRTRENARPIQQDEKLGETTDTKERR